MIDVGGVNGIVRRINIRSTQVETFDNAVIFVPNAEFLSGKLTNWTRNGRMVRQEVAVGVAYGSDIQLVEKLLKQVAKEHQKVLTYPEPVVLFNDFAASSLDFRLRFWWGTSCTAAASPRTSEKSLTQSSPRPTLKSLSRKWMCTCARTKPCPWNCAIPAR